MQLSGQSYLADGFLGKFRESLMHMRVLPTKGFLLEFKKRISIIETAYKLLEKKRDELVKHLKEAIEKLRRTRRSFLSLYRDLFFKFISIYGLIGKETITHATCITRGRLKLVVLPRTIMGVNVPLIRVKETPNYHELPIVVREIAVNLQKLLQLMLELLELEANIEYITYDLQRTNRIVNVLEKVLLPKMRQQLQKLSEMIEEIEIEEFIRTKIIRDKILKRRKQ